STDVRYHSDLHVQCVTFSPSRRAGVCDCCIVFVVCVEGRRLHQLVQASQLVEHMITPYIFFFSSRRRHTRLVSDWSSDVCSSDLSGQCRCRTRSCAKSANTSARQRQCSTPTSPRWSDATLARSEERRVGKECGSRWGRYH